MSFKCSSLIMLDGWIVSDLLKFLLDKTQV